jgi:UDP-N-acetylmuramoyl-tripeptide--D-alanyl-D-alanine ligase
VEQTRAALGRLGSKWRSELSLPVVAVAGSNGKTTTKELLAAVLGRRWPVLASEASYNNDIGVPLTLLRLGRHHRAAVVEVGTNHPGELAPLVRLVKPEVGVLTSLGREHLEFFGSLEGVAEEEGWLAELLPAAGHLLVNGDAPLVERVVSRSRAEWTAVGFGDRCAWRLTRVVTGAAGTEFEVLAQDAAWNGRYHVPLLGRHQAHNALLAVAVGAVLGLSREEVQAGLSACPQPRHRLESWSISGIRVLDDSYNANADSALAALDLLRDLPCGGRRIAVLGDMAELGEAGPGLHAEVGRRAAEAGVDHLIAVGRMAAVLGHAARSAGLGRVLEFADAAGAARAVRRLVRPGDQVLVKASRVMRMEQVSEALRSTFPAR